MTMQVHHGDDQHFAVFHRVNNAVRETMGATAADFRVKRLPGFRPLADAEDGGPDFLNEIMPESWNLPFVVLRRRPQFAGRRKQQAKFHLPNSDAMDRRTSSPSSALSSPARNACKRSRDSASQARSTDSCSAGSRLSQSASMISG